jgi:DNA-binding NtrC family response regulator
MQARVLVVDDEKAMRVALRGLLAREGYHVETAGSGEEARGRIETGNFHVVVTDLSMNGVTGMQVLQYARRFDPDLAVIMITAYGSEKIAVEAMKLGAADYLPKPFDNDELRVVVRRVAETVLLRREHRRLLAQVQGAYGFEQIVGGGAAMRRVFEIIDKVADADVTVLIVGESGTGKELVANALHYRSPRRARPLVKMNCAALSRELVESELFGHERGAFTGAVARREGKFEAADGGTLFLDEVGDMPLETQAKLLRAIQEKEFERVGGNTPIKVDVRLIAATHHDLEAAVRAGRFREDLYYRLRVVEVAIPPLRERREDIPLLVDRFLKDAVERFQRVVKPLTGEALRACAAHEWKGNVRELKSAVEQALLLAPGPEITPADLFGAAALVAPLPAADGGSPAESDAPEPNGSRAESFRAAKERVVAAFERDFLLQALRRHDGNITKAAEDVGMFRQNFQQKMRELGFTVDDATTKPGSEGE